MDIISVFNKTRDLPYVIPISLKEEDFCCSGKCKILKDVLEKQEYKVRYRVCSFSWSSINLPEKVLNISHEDLNTHVFLEIFIDGKWIIMDATWDTGLKSIFHINEWNNISTEIAVNPIEIFSPKKSEDIMNNEKEEDILDDLKINGKFYQTLNNWFEEIRNSRYSLSQG